MDGGWIPSHGNSFPFGKAVGTGCIHVMFSLFPVDFVVGLDPLVMIGSTLPRSVPRRIRRPRGNGSTFPPRSCLPPTLVQLIVLGTSETYGNKTMVDEAEGWMDRLPYHHLRDHPKTRNTTRPTWASRSNSAETNDARNREFPNHLPGANR